MCCSTNMKNDFRNWSDIRVFLTVYREGSTLAASRKLNVAQPTVARRIDVLEQEIGLTLFERDTRGFKPTEHARALYPLAEEVETTAESFRQRAEDLARPRPIRITAPDQFSDATMGIFSSFAAAHPDIAIKFVHSMRILDLRAGEADVAFRVSNADTHPDLIQREIGTECFAIYGAKRYAEQHGMPRSLDDLRGHRFVTFCNPDGPSYAHDWLLRQVSPDQIAMSFNEMSLVDAATKAGHGLALLHTRFADKEAEFIRCFDPIDALSMRVRLLIAPEAYRRPEVRTFTKFFAPRLAAMFK